MKNLEKQNLENFAKLLADFCDDNTPYELYENESPLVKWRAVIHYKQPTEIMLFCDYSLKIDRFFFDTIDKALNEYVINPQLRSFV